MAVIRTALLASIILAVAAPAQTVSAGAHDVAAPAQTVSAGAHDVAAPAQTVPAGAHDVAAPAGAPTAPISAERIKSDVRVLSSDSFAGRGPGQIGEGKTIRFLADAFRRAGLKPGGPNGSWVQPVRLVRFDRVGPVRITATVGGYRLPLTVGQDVTAASRIVGRTELGNAPLVFVGYGIDAPELGWTGFSGADLSGKVAVFLANDPDFEAPDHGAFGGRSMTYAGRFSAKLEAAQRQGAAAVLVIHETAAASYPWSQVASSDALPGFALETKSGDTKSLGLRGWLRREVAVDLFRRAGLDFETLKRRARDPRFHPVPIGDATLKASLTTTAVPVVSHNVVALLPGTTRPDETVIYGAHWDANGVGAPDAKGDRIRNGAVDNATGTATLIEIARAFATGARPQRSVMFIAYTAEEKGLLGAEWYAAHPIRPLETTAAVFNLDPHVVLGATRSLDLIGGGRTDLEDDLRRVAAAQQLRVDPETTPEAGWYFRSDHFAFAKRGVPALYFRAGRDLVTGGRGAGESAAAVYNEQHYHQTSDEFDPTWDMTGAAQEGRVAYELGRELANSRRWPEWHAGVEYKKVRERSAPARENMAAAPRAVVQPRESDAILRNFRFASGETLPELRIHFATLGTPVRDATGQIANAVMVLHGTGGSGRQFLQPQFAGTLFGPGQPLDLQRFYVILPDGIGHGRSSKPSDGLRMRFPAYDYADMVEAQRRLLVDHLGVTRLRLLMGTSMGCMHAFVWGEKHPNFAQAMMPLACLPVAIAGQNRMWRKMAIDAIRADPAWASGSYTQQPAAGLRTAASLLLIAGANPLALQAQVPTREAADAYVAQRLPRDVAGRDANDLLYQLDASRTYDPSAALERIAMPVTWVNSADDFINPPGLGIAEAAAKRLPNGRFVLVAASADTKGHGTHSWARFWSGELIELLRRSER